MKILYCLALLSCLTSAATSAPAQAPSVAPPLVAPSVAPVAASPSGQSYILGPGDVIEVTALGHQDFDTKARIGSDGTIQLPYLGSFVAGDKTTTKLRDQIARALESGGYFSHPILSVEILSYASRYVTVLGGVGTPGLVPIDRAYRLSEILARVGGVREGGSDYVVLTREGQPEQRLAIRDLATGEEARDPYVLAGDKIYVPTEVFYIKGEVKAPGVYPLSHDMTLAMALARGGGLTDIGSESGIEITRNNAEMDPPDLNFKLEPNDIVNVGASWF